MSENDGFGNQYYGTRVAAVSYLQGSSTPQAIAWIVLANAVQQRDLVTATRLLDRQVWIDTANTFALRDAIVAIQDACYELATLVHAKPGLFDAKTADSNIQSVTAGPTNVTFFGPMSIGRFPPSVQELIAPYLAGASSSGGAERLGDCAESQFDDCDRFSLTRGV